MSLWGHVKAALRAFLDALCVCECAHWCPTAFCQAVRCPFRVCWGGKAVGSQPPGRPSAGCIPSNTRFALVWGLGRPTAAPSSACRSTSSTIRL